MDKSLKLTSYSRSFIVHTNMIHRSNTKYKPFVVVKCYMSVYVKELSELWRQLYNQYSYCNSSVHSSHFLFSFLILLYDFPFMTYAFFGYVIYNFGKILFIWCGKPLSALWRQLYNQYSYCNSCVHASHFLFSFLTLLYDFSFMTYAFLVM